MRAMCLRTGIADCIATDDAAYVELAVPAASRG